MTSEKVITPEGVQADLALFAAIKPYADRDRNCSIGELRAICEDVKAAALAYAKSLPPRDAGRIPSDDALALAIRVLCTERLGRVKFIIEKNEAMCTEVADFLASVLEATRSS